jgi:hypothetical protein
VAALPLCIAGCGSKSAVTRAVAVINHGGCTRASISAAARIPGLTPAQRETLRADAKYGPYYPHPCHVTSGTVFLHPEITVIR